MVKKIFKISLFFGGLFLAIKVSAAGIAVTPSVINFQQTVGEQKTQLVSVQNLSGEPVIFHVYTDEFSEQFTVTPDNFQLGVGEKQTVKVSFIASDSGIFATNLSVVSQDLNRRKFNVSTGVKLPIGLNISPAPTSFFGSLALLRFGWWLLLLIAAITVIVVVRRRRRHWYDSLYQPINLLRRHKKFSFKKIFKL